MNARERRVAFDDGASTVLERWGESGPTLLCVHGMTSSRRGWERLAKRFAPTHRVYAYDQRGHGDAAGVHGPMTFERSVRDLLTVIEAIPGPIDGLIGHSWGGAVVLLAGRRVPAGIVVAVDPLIRTAGGVEWERNYVEELLPIFEHAGAERDRVVREMYATLDPLDLAGKLHALHAMSIDPIRRLGLENVNERGEIDLRDHLIDYPRPLSFALADPQQSIVAPEDVDFLRLSGGPNVSIRVFDGEGHSLHRSAFDAFARSLDDVVKAHA